MAIIVQSILTRASETLHDKNKVRWSDPELIRYLNDGIRTLVTGRPDVSAKRIPFTPVSGARQAVPASAVTLLDVLGNNSGPQRAVYRVDLQIMSSTNRDWESSLPSATALNFMFDVRDPYVFYVYPPSNGLGGLDLLCSVFPADVVNSTDTVDLPAQWLNALLNYVLSRAYAKDAEYGNNSQKSAEFMSAFAAEAVGQLKTQTAVSPKA